MMEKSVTINQLGHQGDGVGNVNGNSVFVPFTLPGEIAIVKGGGSRRELVEIIDASPQRAEPVCSHFGICGGCRMQHMAQEPYLHWKRNLLVEALQREMIDVDLEPILHYPVSARRRAVLTARFAASGPVLGFSERSSNRIVNVVNCPVLLNGMNALLSEIRHLLAALGPFRGSVRIHLLACENGHDLGLEFPKMPSDVVLRQMSGHPSTRHFIRLSVNGETVIEAQRPSLDAGIARVSPPPGAFVQASAAAENDMARLSVDHLGGCKRVMDLFCGIGTFALRLAEHSMVHGVESDALALTAMDRAWRETGGRLKALTHERRDLFRQPVQANEMKKFDGVLFDPPRAGAEAQAGEIAKSSISRVVAVSCNPATLARDLRILVDGGFRLKKVTPIDQFIYSPHLEAVALLER